MKKGNRKASMQDTFSLKRTIIWSIPSIILILFVSLHAVIYVNNQYEQTREAILHNVQNVTKEYARELESELNQLAAQARPMAMLLSSVSDRDMETIANSLVSMKESTAAYQVLYANTDGKAVLESGNVINLVHETYFQSTGSEQTTITYTSCEMVTGNSAIVISVPVKNEGQVKGYLLLYYPTNQFETLFSSSAFSKTAFYALSDEEGYVFSVDGYSSVLVEKGANLFETQKDAVFGKNEKDSFYIHFTHRTNGCVLVSMGKEKKLLFYEPVEDTNVMLLMGVDYSYLYKQLEKEMNPTYIFIGYLIGFILLYILVMFALFIIWRIQKKQSLNGNLIDSATGLYTKEAAGLRIRDYIEKQPDSMAAMFVIDIDNFAAVNEKLGKAFGDSVLKSFAGALQSRFREYDIISRYGGNQFVVFLKYFPNEELLRKEAAHVAETFCDCRFENESLEISTSIGVGIFPKDGKSVEELYQNAQESLQVAKSMGKNQMVYYEEIMPEDAFI